MIPDSPEGLGPLYTSEKDSFCVPVQRVRFFRASRLYSPETGESREWPPEATDAEVADAIAELEQTEATDEEVRSIFADRGPEGRESTEIVPLDEADR